MPRYSCSLLGQCEEDAYGFFESLEQCQANCRAVGEGLSPDREIALIAVDYEPELATDLSPLDAKYYLYSRYKIVVTAEEAMKTLIAALADAYDALYLAATRNETIMAYLRTKLDEVDFAILDLVSGLVNANLSISLPYRRLRLRWTTRRILTEALGRRRPADLTAQDVRELDPVNLRLRIDGLVARAICVTVASESGLSAGSDRDGAINRMIPKALRHLPTLLELFGPIRYDEIAERWSA